MQYKGKTIYDKTDLVVMLRRQVREGKIDEYTALRDLRANCINTLEYFKDKGELDNIELTLQLMSLQNNSIDIHKEVINARKK